MLADTPSRAVITGGPWTLGQGPTTQTNPAADYPNPNPGTNNFAPYFWPQTLGDEREMLGLFDYRPRNMQEAVVAARSHDGGRSWDFVQLALDFNPNPTPNPTGGNENGQGHPFVMRVQGKTLLYTLDRTPGDQGRGRADRPPPAAHPRRTAARGARDRAAAEPGHGAHRGAAEPRRHHRAGARPPRTR